MDELYLSRKLKVLSFLLTLAVIEIHSYFIESEGSNISGHVQPVINYLCGVAVPFFFCISGFLFFYKLTSKEHIVDKICRRAQTLLVPYLTWNIIYFAFYLCLLIIPSVENIINNNLANEILKNELPDAIEGLFWEPFACHLWYVRDLMLFVLLTPLVYKYIRKIPLLLLLVFTIFIPLTGINQSEMLGYFLIGAKLACEDVDLHKRNPRSIVYLALLIFVMMGIFPINNMSFREIAMLLGIFSFWYLYDYIFVVFNKLLKPLSERTIMNDFLGCTFFVYCSHGIFLNIIKKAEILFLGCSDFALLFTYLLNPILCYSICFLISKLINSTFPRFYLIISGNRI